MLLPYVDAGTIVRTFSVGRVKQTRGLPPRQRSSATRISDAVWMFPLKLYGWWLAEKCVLQSRVKCVAVRSQRYRFLAAGGARRAECFPRLCAIWCRINPMRNLQWQLSLCKIPPPPLAPGCHTLCLLLLQEGLGLVHLSYQANANSHYNFWNSGEVAASLCPSPTPYPDPLLALGPSASPTGMLQFRYSIAPPPLPPCRNSAPPTPFWRATGRYARSVWISRGKTSVQT